MFPYNRSLPPPGDARVLLRPLLETMLRALGNGMESEAPPPRHLRDYWRIVYLHRRLAAACFGAVVFLTLLITALSARQYTASMRIQVARQSPIQLRLDNSILSVDQSRGDSTASSFVAMQVAALESRDLAARVIRKHGLTEHAREAVSNRGALLDFLRPRGWRKPREAQAHGSGAPRRNDGVTPIAFGAGEEASVPPRVLDRYMEYLSIRPIVGTDIIEVRFTTPTPALSAFLAGAHTQAYMEVNDETRRGTDVVAKQFLVNQISDARRQVERAEDVLGTFAVEHPDVVANQEQATVGQRITEHSRALAEAQEARATLESQFKFLTDRKSEPLAYFLDRPAVQKLRGALVDVRAQRASLAERLGSRHPQMLDLRRLESELDKQLRGEVSEEVKAVRTRYNAARVREEGLQRELVDHQADGVRLRALGAKYDALKHNADTAREHHSALLRKEQATAASANLAASHIRVVERAEVPQSPSHPKVPLNLALGIMAGTLVGLGAAFGRDYFDQTVRSSEDIERSLQIPALAAIPSFERHGPAPRLLGGYGMPFMADDDAMWDGDGSGAAVAGAELVMLHRPFSNAAEAFRSMRTSVLFSVPRPAHVVVVTSARNGEGKTVASANLAAALAELGGRVLLIDADLRRPRCHRVLGVECAAGLSNTLVGDVDPARAICSARVPNLYFLPAGPAPANAADLVGGARMQHLLEYLKPQFDFLVLDTPPVLAVTDAVVLARAADRVVLIAKGQSTPRDLVRQARDRLLAAGVRFLGVAVNDVGPGWGDYTFYDPTSADGHSRASAADGVDDAMTDDEEAMAFDDATDDDDAPVGDTPSDGPVDVDSLGAAPLAEPVSGNGVCAGPTVVEPTVEPTIEPTVEAPPLGPAADARPAVGDAAFAEPAVGPAAFGGSPSSADDGTGRGDDAPPRRSRTRASKRSTD